MKAQIFFDLPEDNFDLKLALLSSDIYSLMDDVYQDLRSIVKHGDVEDEKLYNRLEHIKDTIGCFMSKIEA